VDVLRSLVAQADSVASSVAMDGTARQAALLYSAALASMKLRDTDQAERLLTRLQAAVRFDAPALRLARLLSVELALQAADPRLAARRIDPSATDRPTLFLLAQVALLAHKKSLETGGVALDAKSVGDMLAEVLQRLQVWVSSHPRDGGAWQQLASVAAAQNQPLRAVPMPCQRSCKPEVWCASGLIEHSTPFDFASGHQRQSISNRRGFAFNSIIVPVSAQASMIAGILTAYGSRESSNRPVKCPSIVTQGFSIALMIRLVIVASSSVNAL
jgi:hypothetical protein